MELDPHVSPEKIMSSEVELGCESWTSFASSFSSTAVQRTLSLSLCPSTAVETAVAQCTSRWAMARGHRLNTSIVLAAVYGLSGLFRAVSTAGPFTLSPPSHSVPVPNRPARLCGRKATLNHLRLFQRPTLACWAVPSIATPRCVTASCSVWAMCP